MPIHELTLTESAGRSIQLATTELFSAIDKLRNACNDKENEIAQLKKRIELLTSLREEQQATILSLRKQLKGLQKQICFSELLNS